MIRRPTLSDARYDTLVRELPASRRTSELRTPGADANDQAAERGRETLGNTVTTTAAATARVRRQQMGAPTD